MLRLRLIYVILFVSAMLIGTVHLRVSTSRVFFQYRKAYVEHFRLKQQLWQKQIVLETLITPKTVEKPVPVVTQTVQEQGEG